MSWDRCCPKMRGVWCVVRVASLLVVLGLGLMARPQPLYAHNELRQSFPTAGQILNESPPEIRLTFSEPSANVFIKLYDRQFQEIPGLQVLAAAPDASEAIAQVPKLKAGTYTVQWLTLSADNHTVSGTFQFEVRGTSQAGLINGIIMGVFAAAVLTGLALFSKQIRSSPNQP